MLKKLRIVTLSENTVFANGFHAEWGISVLAETEEGNTAFDGSAGSAFASVHRAANRRDPPRVSGSRILLERRGLGAEARRVQGLLQ